MKKLFTYTLSLLLIVPFITHAQFENYPDMELGYTGEPVVELQKFLNANNYIINPIVGEEGSIGYEGTYFGKLTQKALSLFQKDNNILPSVGYFGTKTKAGINSVIKKAEEGTLSLSPLVGGGTNTGLKTYNVNYYVSGISANTAGCNNRSYTPTIVGTSNTVGPFSYPVKMSFSGTVDDNLMVNGVIVDKTAALNGGNCSHKHSVSYTKDFPANTAIRFNIVDQYGVEASMVGTITITPMVSDTVKLKTATINGGIINQPSLNGTYRRGEVIEITAATTTPGFIFDKWSGACTGTSPKCTLTMDMDKTVTAAFVKAIQLTFNIKGPGTIKANIAAYGRTPTTTTFNKTTTMEVPYSADIRLNAIALPTSKVIGWTDAKCKKTAVTDAEKKDLMCNTYPTFVRSYQGDSNVTFSAEFAVAPTKFKLNVSSSNAIMGTVSPSGITEYEKDKFAEITARAKAGYRFVSWTGCPGYPDSLCKIKMDSNKTVKANFAKIKCTGLEKISVEEAIERIHNNPGLSPQQKEQQINDINSSWFSCHWSF
jgi:uncharacterized repeat protein (TIGR02543 family)